MRGANVQFDNIIQVGIWTGSAEQIACIRQTARDANFEGYSSIEEYLEQIKSAHNEEDTEGERGPIDDDARTRYENAFRAAWECAECSGIGDACTCDEAFAQMYEGRA